MESKNQNASGTGQQDDQADDSGMGFGDD